MSSNRSQRSLNANAPVFYPDFFSRQQQPGEVFPQFALLQEELLVHILSFVADAPFEINNEVACSSLTHALPFVSHKFHQLVNGHDCFWKDALVRQATKFPALWKRGLLQLRSRDDQPSEDQSVSDLVESLKISLQVNSQELYRLVLNTKIRFVGPVFYMPHPIRMGEPYGLHFFEPRYRHLIAEVMDPYPESAKQGEAIIVQQGQSPPVFIHAYNHPLTRLAPVVLVQVVRCRIYPDGRADVFLLPVTKMNLENIWERPHTGHLYYAQCMRADEEQVEFVLSDTL